MNSAREESPLRYEQEYLDCLEHERDMFAWVLVNFGRVAAPEAEEDALRTYPYEPPSPAGRGLVFHDRAWHWAMLTLHGPGYWRANPELLAGSPPSMRRKTSGAGPSV